MSSTSTTPFGRSWTFASLIALFTAVFALGAPPVGAQECGADRREPVVCRVELTVFRPGERRGEALSGATLRLATRSEVEIAARGIDQYDRRFPAERFEYFLDLDRDCNDMLSVEETEEGVLRLDSGSRSGDCRALLWLPNDLNHDRELRVVVERPDRQSYSREEAELLATWLYRAVLDREPNPGGLQAATDQIQQGRLSEYVHSLVGSPEFQRRRSDMSALELLESFYRGLFDREPNTGGVRAYVRPVERGAYGDVLRDLLASEELEARLDRALDSP